MTEFTAIDFETANSSRSSACSIGLAVVRAGEVIDVSHHLLKPEPAFFDPFNIAIHGITDQDVQDAPTLRDLWPELEKSIRGPLLAHNASFDMSVLRHALDLGRKPYPDTDYFCSCVISRYAWPEHRSYSLDHLADFLEVDFEHHNAAEDARAAAIIALKACESLRSPSLYDLPNCCPLRIGHLYPTTYTPCGGPRRL